MKAKVGKLASWSQKGWAFVFLCICSHALDLAPQEYLWEDTEHMPLSSHSVESHLTQRLSSNVGT